MIGQEIIYAPCPCGSGKKFKFCCYKKYRSQLSDDMTLTEVVQLVRCDMIGIKDDELPFKPESVELHDEGYHLMKALRIDEARPKFRRAREIDPRHGACWNNEASCAWEMGDYEAAYEIQREGNANMLENDSFGLARLAVYAHATGREEEAVRSLESALAVPPISIFGALEVCCALALYHRHRDIIDYAAKSGMADSNRLAFYTGIAHANLEEMGQAELDLRKTGDSQHAYMAYHYLDLIEDGVLPWTAEGEDVWPYFDRVNFKPARDFIEDVVDGEDPFVRCPKPLAEDCIAFLLADNSLETHDALTLVRKLKSDRAKRMAESLERMVKAEEDAEADGEARRAADVDAQGRPRVSFDLAYLSVSGSECCLSETDEEAISLANEVIESNLPATDDTYVRMENHMRELARKHPDSVCANLPYFSLIEGHDPELARGLTDSFCRQHPDNLHCAGLRLLLCVRAGEFGQAAEILDHFSVPEGEYEPSKCKEWGAALLMLSLSDDFSASYPDAAARVKEFVARFTAKD